MDLQDSCGIEKDYSKQPFSLPGESHGDLILGYEHVVSPLLIQKKSSKHGLHGKCSQKDIRVGRSSIMHRHMCRSRLGRIASCFRLLALAPTP